jgi:hypothetical protein
VNLKIKVTLFETLQMLMFVFTPYLWVCNILIHVVWFLHKIHNFVYNFFKRKKRGNASGRIVLFLLFCFNECKFHSLKQNGGIVLSLFQGYTVQLFKNGIVVHRICYLYMWKREWCCNACEIDYSIGEKLCRSKKKKIGEKFTHCTQIF